MKQETIAVLIIFGLFIIMLFGAIIVGAVVSSNQYNPEIISMKDKYVKIDDNGNIIVLNVFGDTICNDNIYYREVKLPELKRGELTKKKQ